MTLNRHKIRYRSYRLNILVLSERLTLLASRVYAIVQEVVLIRTSSILCNT